jgi:hypothetical protein
MSCSVITDKDTAPPLLLGRTGIEGRRSNTYATLQRIRELHAKRFG